MVRKILGRIFKQWITFQIKVMLKMFVFCLDFIRIIQIDVLCSVRLFKGTN